MTLTKLVLKVNECQRFQMSEFSQLSAFRPQVKKV
jgi:hypothetical protein